MSGFGEIDSHNSDKGLSKGMKYSWLKLVKPADCKKIMESSEAKEYSNTTLCTYTRGSPSCIRDTGSPLVAISGPKKTLKLLGIATWGPDNCEESEEILIT